MTDEDALIAAIAVAPADDFPRLVCADWLEEHNRPAEATFLRLECAVRGGDGDKLPRLREVGATFPADWLAAVGRPALLGTTWVDGDRDLTLAALDKPYVVELDVHRFAPGGVLLCSTNRRRTVLRPGGEWRQVGPWVWFTVNDVEGSNPYSLFEGHIIGDRMEVVWTTLDGWMQSVVCSLVRSR